MVDHAERRAPAVSPVTVTGLSSVVTMPLPSLSSRTGSLKNSEATRGLLLIAVIRPVRGSKPRPPVLVQVEGHRVVVRQGLLENLRVLVLEAHHVAGDGQQELLVVRAVPQQRAKRLVAVHLAW